MMRRNIGAAGCILIPGERTLNHFVTNWFHFNDAFEVDGTQDEHALSSYLNFRDKTRIKGVLISLLQTAVLFVLSTGLFSFTRLILKARFNFFGAICFGLC